MNEGMERENQPEVGEKEEKERGGGGRRRKKTKNEGKEK